ncbi:MAG: DeoR/GlpR family DNA-binding transcription regulator [Verrucomicrobiia bacterium]
MRRSESGVEVEMREVDAAGRLRVEGSYAERADAAIPNKRRIAEVAVSSIPSGSVIFLDAGTTMFMLAEVLAQKCPGPLCVVTHSLRVAYLLGSVEEVEVRMLGGRLMAEEMCLLSSETMAALSTYRFDMAFLSGGGMTQKGVWNSDPRLILFQRSVISRSLEVWFCLDRMKAGKETGLFLAPWRVADVLLTDATAADLARARISTRGIKVMNARSKPPIRPVRGVTRKAIY